MKKILSVMLALLVMLSVCSFGSTAFADKHESGWFKEYDGWHYYDEDGEQPYCEQIGYVWEDEAWYYFGYHAVMQTGWIKEVWSYVDDETGQTVSGTEWYYAKQNGRLVQEWYKVNNVWYYFEPGAFYMYSNGIYEINGKSYFIKPSGAMATGWCCEKYNYDGGTYTDWYYAKADGSLTKGWAKISGVWYYFDPQCFWMYSSTSEKIDGKLYFFKSSGAMASGGWAKDNWEDWYYANADGSLVTGWKKISGTWYYFDPSEGNMYVGGATINNKIYLFNGDGAWIKPSGTGWKSIKITYNTYNGKRTETQWYYIKNGTVATGWQKLGGKWYFLDKNSGIMYSAGAYFTAEDEIYFFESSGAMKTTKGWAKETYWDGSYDWYYVNADGTCYRGWLQLGGNWYYLDEDYAYMYCDCEAYINGGTYTFDANGVCTGVG